MKRYLCTLLSLLFIFSLSAQLSVDNAGTTYTIDFDNPVAGVNAGQYDGSGLNPSPSNGQLDGDAWEIIGLSDGDHLFGGTNTTGDFGRGASAGVETTGGLYAFDVSGAGDYAFGFQPSGSDLNPGDIKLKIDNNTGSFIVNLDISYEIWEFNDQNRDTDLSFAWSYDNSNWNTLSSLDYTTPASSGGATWNLGDTKYSSIGIVVPTGSSIYFRWETRDGTAGSGQRDELALDDIQITANTNDNPLIISEIMPDPQISGSGATLTEPDAEWFEVFNNSSYNIELGNLDLLDNSFTHTISSSTIINSGDYFAFGRADGSSNGPYTEDYIYGSLAFANGGDLIRIEYPDGSTIDEVDFTSWSLMTAGRSMYFDGNSTDDNNFEGNWVNSGSREFTYTGSDPSADMGSPGFNGSGQLLPLRITRFDGNYWNNQIQLAWKVEQTEGIEKFEVELSKDGKHFEKIGEVSALNDLLRYQFAEDYRLNDVAYVRLKQIDKAGTYFYTNVISLHPENADHIVLYPNPAGELLFISADKEISNAQYQILDHSGRIVKSGIWTGNEINLGALPSGVYHLRLSQNQTLLNKTFLKQ